MITTKIASGQQVTRPATKEEKKKFLDNMRRKANIEGARVRLTTLLERNAEQKEDKAKLIEAIEKFEVEINRRAEEMTVTEWQTVTRDATADEMAQFEKDRKESEEARAREQVEREARQAKMDAFARRLSVTREDLADILRAVNE